MTETEITVNILCSDFSESRKTIHPKIKSSKTFTSSNPKEKTRICGIKRFQFFIFWLNVHMKKTPALLTFTVFIFSELV